MRRLPLRDVAGVAISILSAGAVVWWAASQEAPRFPTDARGLVMIGLALLVYLIATVARGWRWHQILRRTCIDHEATDAYCLVAVGYMGNTVLPARGGEGLRVLLLADRTDARRREVLGSIVAERIIDAVALVMLFAVLTFTDIAGAPAGSWPAVGGLSAMLGGAVVLLAYLRLRRAGRFDRFAEVLRPMARSSRILASRAGLGLIALTVCVWLSEGVIFTLVAEALGLDLDLLEGTFIVVLASFFALIPAAPGYVGTLDAALLFGLAAVDIRGGSAVSFVLLSRFVLFGPITVAGLVLLLTRYGGVARAYRRVRDHGGVSGEQVSAARSAETG